MTIAHQYYYYYILPRYIKILAYKDWFKIHCHGQRLFFPPRYCYSNWGLIPQGSLYPRLLLHLPQWLLTIPPAQFQPKWPHCSHSHLLLTPLKARRFECQFPEITSQFPVLPLPLESILNIPLLCISLGDWEPYTGPSMLSLLLHDMRGKHFLSSS